MALTTYSELQTAIQTEMDRDNVEFTGAIPDLIARCEAKLNRKVRLREMEQLAFTTYYASAGSKFLPLPTAYVELINLRIKKESESDTEYKEVKYVDPALIHHYYGTSDGSHWYFTLRDDIEMCRLPVVNHTVMMHYLKRWDIANDSTNWLLTNYPDAYLYGALVEAEAFLVNDSRVPMWKSFFLEAMAELNELSERGRDDATLLTTQIGRMGSGGTFNITTG